MDRCRAELDEATIDWLVGLDETTTIAGTLYCHASPHSDMKSFDPDDTNPDEELLSGVDAPRVVFGHTHRQWQRSGPGDVQLANPGSVGTPWDGDHDAAYAVVHDDGRIELRRVAYDWQRRRAGGPRARGRAARAPHRTGPIRPPVMLRSRQCGCRAS